MKQVYIAAPWIHGGDALDAKAKCEGAGLGVTSRWLARVKGNTDPTYDYTKDPNYTKPDAVTEADKDQQDVRRADAVVLLNLAKSEGKAVETGMAIAYGIPIVMVGQPTNTFNYYAPPRLYQVGTVEEAIEVVKGLK